MGSGCQIETVVAGLSVSGVEPVDTGCGLGEGDAWALGEAPRTVGRSACCKGRKKIKDEKDEEECPVVAGEKRRRAWGGPGNE